MKWSGPLHSGLLALGLCIPSACSLAGAGDQQARETPSAENERVRQARETLLNSGTEPVSGLGVPASDPRLIAIRDLHAIGSPAAVDALFGFLTQPYGDNKLRMQALVALGVVGTKEAVAALDQFGRWAEGRRSTPPPFRFGQHAYTIHHYSSVEVQPAATANDAAGRRWAIFQSPLPAWLGAWWVTSTTDEKRWDQPVLVGPSAMPELLIRQIASGERALASFSADRDRDGLSDLMEERIGRIARAPIPTATACQTVATAIP